MKGYTRVLSISAGAVALGMLTMTSPALDAQAAGDVQRAVDAAYAKFKDLREGKNADYIPALAKVDPNLFGIAVVTVDGKVYTAGDVKTEVSIQSISKVFTMAEVIQEQGLDSIEKRIGVDATGARFNSIIAVEGVRTVIGSGAPEMNALVNPGAISATSMVSGSSSDEVWKKIIGFHNDAAGRQLSVLQDVYKSESDTNQRNQAIGALMLAYGYIKNNWQQAVDLYTRQCSIGVNAQDLAMMAATLAFAGKNPVTNRQVMDPAKVPGVLAVMATAGLYDDSGKWLYHTGLPAKSGVGGGIIAVSPGKFGIAVVSPPLDDAGNSVRAQRAIADISNALGGNPYAARAKTNTIKTGAGMSSKSFVQAFVYGRYRRSHCVGVASGGAKREAAHRHCRHRRNHRRRGGVHDGRWVQVRRGRRGRADRRRAADEEVRGRARRAGVLGRQPGHERRAVGEARDRSQSAAGAARCRRRGDHARHRHDGGDGVLPQSRREERQAGGPDRLDAAVDVAQRGRPAEHLQRRRRRVAIRGRKGAACWSSPTTTSTARAPSPSAIPPTSRRSCRLKWA